MTTVVKDMPLTGKSISKLIEAMEYDINDALKYISTNDPQGKEDFDMFDVDDWDWLAYGLCDIEQHIAYMADERKIVDSHVRKLSIKLKSSEGGLKYWMNKYNEEIGEVKKQQEFWRKEFDKRQVLEDRILANSPKQEVG